MLLPGTFSPRTWLLFTVIISLIILGETLDHKRLDINVQFDLIQGNNGELHIKNLEGARDVNRRADDDSDESGKKSKGKDESSDNSDSDDAPKKHSAEKPTHKESDNSDSDSGDNDTNEKLLSTRGLKPDDFDPEDSPKAHKKYKHGEDDDDSDR